MRVISPTPYDFFILSEATVVYNQIDAANEFKSHKDTSASHHYFGRAGCLNPHRRNDSQDKWLRSREETLEAGEAVQREKKKREGGRKNREGDQEE